MARGHSNWKGGSTGPSRSPIIVVAWQATHWNPVIARQRLESFIACPGLVLDDIPGRQDEVGLARIRKCLIERGHERVVRVHPAHPGIPPRMQVCVGDVQDAQGLGHAETIAVIPRGP